MVHALLRFNQIPVVRSRYSRDALVRLYSPQPFNYIHWNHVHLSQEYPGRGLVYQKDLCSNRTLLGARIPKLQSLNQT